ncbi:polysaccharide deacetylase family protein [Variovorax sp. dw_954]|uniref:polysaccharide deacetylase family protein n=1 Tax=Variovorax sp. dw_954 TaxID=2720078 RepID=UPI001BD6528A|nr:polysaccharide deacetylase family protein [Variovorax sp. dw_954]
MSRPITLTFDNGPTTTVTPHVLDVLARYGIRATFFVLGQNLMSRETMALAQLAAEQGHWIGNHTYTHDVPLGETTDPDAPLKEIGRTQDLIGRIAHPDRLFRPFGGGGVLGTHLLSPEAFELLKTNRYTCVFWNSIPRDWEDPDGWVETALAQARRLEWALTVLHDYETGAMRNLEAYLDKALAEGFTFRQEFPPDCVPMVRGRPVLPMEAFIATSRTTLSPQET